MRRSTSLLLVTLVTALATACGTEEKKGGTSSNNASNNMTTNNVETNNASNNTSANNTETNNESTNNTTNNATNNATNATNNGTTTTNNGSTGGMNSCADQGLTECYTNDDCDADRRCEGSGAGINGCCHEGERGTGEVGENCEDENDCASGVCIQRNDDPYICSKECAGEEDCPGDLECQPVLALCVTPG